MQALFDIVKTVAGLKRKAAHSTPQFRFNASTI
jgi:hypothetical protein